MTQITTLPNGLRVATESIPFAETTTIGVWINSGSRFETDANNGVAHFLEHILFKGTKVGVDASHHGHIMQSQSTSDVNHCYVEALGERAGDRS